MSKIIISDGNFNGTDIKFGNSETSNASAFKTGQIQMNNSNPPSHEIKQTSINNNDVHAQAENQNQMNLVNKNNLRQSLQALFS